MIVDERGVIDSAFYRYGRDVEVVNRERCQVTCCGGRDLPLKTPPHPGPSVRHDCLGPLGLSVTEAAKNLGVSRKQLSDVVNGHSGISPEMAIRLDKAFGGGADTWYRLQAAYDLAQAMKRAGRIKVERLSPVP